MTVAIALMGLLGYVPGLGFLGSLHEGYIPMAPSTAVSFILLGGMLLYLVLSSRTAAPPKCPIQLLIEGGFSLGSNGPVLKS